MESFIEGVGERYLKRKTNAIPQQLEKLAKKQVKDATGNRSVQVSMGSTRPSRQQDEEIERLRKELAAAKIHQSKSESASMRKNFEVPKARQEPYKLGRLKANKESRKPSIREVRDTRSHHEADSPKLSQADITRLALQHADTSKLPLKARNLELFTSQQHRLDQASKHGGSAALLHASRAQPGRRETLAFSSLDSQGNPSTEAFRPRRTSDRRLCLVEVLEEPDKRQPRSSPQAQLDRKQSKGGWRPGETGPGAAGVGQTEGRRVMRVR